MAIYKQILDMVDQKDEEKISNYQCQFCGNTFNLKFATSNEVMCPRCNAQIVPHVDEETGRGCG